MKLNRLLILALAAATTVAAATDCSKFKTKKKCTKKNKCKYEKRACVAKSTCEQQTKKGKCKKAGDCTWEGEKKGCVDAGESDGFTESTSTSAFAGASCAAQDQQIVALNANITNLSAEVAADEEAFRREVEAASRDAGEDETVAPDDDGAPSTGPIVTLLIGMAGSGKTTLFHRLHYDSQEKGRRCYFINLDPAVLEVPIEPQIDIRDTIDYKATRRRVVGGGPRRTPRPRSTAPWATARGPWRRRSSSAGAARSSPSSGPWGPGRARSCARSAAR